MGIATTSPTPEGRTSQPNSPTRPAPDASGMRERYAAMGAVQPCLIILTALALLAVVYFAKAVLMPATLALVLALVLRPVVAAFRRHGVPAGFSATIIFGSALVLVAVASVTLFKPAQGMIAKAPETLTDVAARLREYAKPFEQLEEAQEQVDEVTRAPGEIRAVRVQIDQPTLSSDTLNATGGYAASIAITVALLYFLLALGDRFLEKTVQLIPTWRGKRDAVETLREIERRISRYLGAITIVNIGLGVVIGVGFWLIDMPNAMVWGVLAALLNYIPFVGLAVGTVLSAIAGLAQFEELGRAILPPVIYLIANGIEANLVTPAAMGRSIDLNPVVILLAVLLGGWLWGIVGVFLSVPLLIIAKIFCESQEGLRPIAVYLSN
ncbi:AI-2E family transporter [Botrimarina sp.]|uniref:AI-2E family transporter n=1 Tax=Botrimarina sp. TaxID=2795802 RepID=UPI0032EFB61F